jgi:hypothetical protein
MKGRGGGEAPELRQNVCVYHSERKRLAVQLGLAKLVSLRCAYAPQIALVGQ